MNSISNISLQPPAMPNVAAGARPNSEVSFKNLLLESIDQVNPMQQDADKAVQQFVTGGDVNPAEVLTALQKADLSFRNPNSAIRNSFTPKSVASAAPGFC